MFKLFDLSGFADGFEKYDLLAKRVRPYGFIYPFFELGLGLAYFARWQVTGIYMATIVLMVFGATGVLTALKKGLDINSRYWISHVRYISKNRANMFDLPVLLG